MSPALDIEVDILDSLLDDEIPCEASISRPPDYMPVQCGEPSVARIKGTCAACGYVKVGFVCAYDLEMLKSGMLFCSNCSAGGIDYGGSL
jgi:hypothetical protein